jgi:hypothetical protein
MRLGISSMVVAGALLVGCGGGGDENEESAARDPVTGDALETCLTDKGLDVERGEPGPIQFGEAGTLTPEAGLIENAGSFPRSEILVLEPEDAESYDRTLPPGVKDKNRFGANVLVLVTEVSPVGPIRRPPTPPADVRKALDACVS